MKTTVAIQIGNSDNKLTQLRWSDFIYMTDYLVRRYAEDVHFTGFSIPTATWQNACWLFIIDTDNSPKLWDALKLVREEFRQDSIAWTEGITVFITP